MNVLYGASGGLSAVGNQLWHQDSPGIADTAETNDGYGSDLSAGDFNADGVDDLAVASAGEDIDTVQGAGAVNVILGTPAGLSASGSQLWHQDSPEILDANEESDGFGGTLATGDFNGDGLADLVIGVPAEDIASATDAGAVNVLYGSAFGLSATGNQFWHQDSDGIKGAAQTFDLFAESLAGR